MKTYTKNKMIAYAQTLPPCAAKAQCYTIANYQLRNEFIADRIIRDHSDSISHLRAASLMVDAGCAVEMKTERNERRCTYGRFIFEDGSQF